jgi:glucokinase
MGRTSDGPRIFGVDVGGTSIKYGATAGEKNPLAGLTFLTDLAQHHAVPSEVRNGPEATVQQIVEAHRKLLDLLHDKHLAFDAVGVAVAGPSLESDGTILFSGNFGEVWRGVSLRNSVRDKFNIPTTSINDANAAGLAEQMEQSRYAPDVSNTPGLLATVGTGLGTAVFGRDGQLYVGSLGLGGEYGHSPMPTEHARSTVKLEGEANRCSCGRTGCAELYTSRAFLSREVVARRSQDPNNPIYSGSKAEWADAVPVEAAKGNALALQILKDQAFNLGLFLGRLDLINDYKWLIIGGGVSNADDKLKDAYMREVKAGFQREADPNKVNKVEISFARLGNNAGWIGASIAAHNMVLKGSQPDSQG